MTFCFADVVNIRIFFLIIHFLWLIHHFYHNIKFIPKSNGEWIPTTITGSICSSVYIKLQQHEAILFIQCQLYMGMYIGKILLTVRYKELIIYLVLKLVNARLQTHKRNFICSPA